jgi:hypothetical protein
MKLCTCGSAPVIMKFGREICCLKCYRTTSLCKDEAEAIARWEYQAIPTAVNNAILLAIDALQSGLWWFEGYDGEETMTRLMKPAHERLIKLLTPTDGAGEPGSRAQSEGRMEAHLVATKFPDWFQVQFIDNSTPGDARTYFTDKMPDRYAKWLVSVLAIPSSPLAVSPSEPTSLDPNDQALEASNQHRDRQNLTRVGLQWTREKPTQSGFYWLRMPDGELEILPTTELAKLYDMVPIGQKHPFEIAGPIPEPGAEPGALPTGGAGV